MRIAPNPRTFVVTRSRLRLTLGAPYALLLLASAGNWAWRALDWPGMLAGVSPIAIAALVAAAALGMIALRRGLPLGMLTWLPAGLGGLMILATGLIATSGASTLAGVAIIVAYTVFFVIMLALTTALASHGTPLALGYMAFFVLTQATRFPVFEVEATVAVDAATLLTAVAGAIAVAEIGVLVWLANALVHAVASDSEEEPTEDGMDWPPLLWLLGLTAAHGVLAGWEDPVLQGAFGFGSVLEQAVRWWALAGLQLGVAFVFIRIRRSWLREPVPERPAADAANEDEPPAISDPTPFAATRRRRRRRR